jgi:TPP-dependent 2-oxoacid decarboxylase
LLDGMLTVPGIRWMGTANELNAAYAADAYARVTRRPAAIVTTYGVGELSAINGVAGSFAEDVPVIQITGAPSTVAAASGALIHHTLVDGVFDHFSRAYAEVTVAGSTLRTATAAAEIDRVLIAALTHSKPVYLSIPTDVAVGMVPRATLAYPLRPAGSDPEALAAFRARLQETLQSSERVTVLAGPRVHRSKLERPLEQLADTRGVQVATQSGSKAIIDESHSASLGTYLGAFTVSPFTRDAVDGATSLVLVGTVLSDLLTGFFSHRFDPTQAIELGLSDARIGGANFYNVRMQDALATLLDIVRGLGLDELPPPPAPPSLPEQRPTLDGPLTQEEFWRQIQGWLPDDVIAIADAGTAFYGALELTLPPGGDLVGQGVWSSIGYSLPAVLGTSLAAPGRRSVLFIGDGSAQLTIQELATLLHGGHTPVIFLINNGGYTVERAIQSPDAAYQDVTSWNWTALARAFAPDIPSTSRTVSTGAELQHALHEAASSPDRLQLIEVVVPRMDTPRILTELAAGLAAANSDHSTL